jgi:hypothetical protein
MIDGSEQAERYFYGLLPRWLGGDRLYRVYVGKEFIVGAYIAGQLYDQQSAAIQLQHLLLVLAPLVRRLLSRRAEREARYDTLDPFEPTLVDYDRRNFRISKSDIARTKLRRNRSLWTTCNVGAVEIELLDRTNRRFILVGEQDQDEILKLMQQFDPGIEVRGKANPRPRPRTLSTRGKRLLLAIVALLLVCQGSLFAHAALTRLKRDPTLWPISVASFLAAGWFVVRACKVKVDV